MKLNYIQCGDCLELIKNIPDNSIDLIITDPPYEKKDSGRYQGGGAFGTNNREYHTKLDNQKLLNGINEQILDELVRVLKKGNIYIWCNKQQLKQYINYFENLGWNTDLLTWHKTNPVPTCSNKYLSDTEYLLFFREKGVKVYGSYKTKRKWYATPTNKKDKEKYKHPTIKPLDIIENLVINSSLEGGVILDPYIGSGTTAVASLKHNRHYIGFEINEDYCKIATQRIDELKEEK